MTDTAKQASEQVWQLAVDELYGEIHPNADNVLPKAQAIIEQALQAETAALREEVERLRSALKLAAPYIEFYAECEIRSPSNGEEAVRKTREMLRAVRDAVREGQKGSE